MIFPLTGRCRIHNGGAKKREEAPNFKHGRRSKYGIFLGEATHCHLWLKALRSVKSQKVIRNAINNVFDRLNIGGLAPFVLSELYHEIGRLSKEVESGAELQWPRHRRRERGVSQEQIKQLCERMEQKWLGGGGSKQTRPGRKSKWKSIELGPEPEATHTQFVFDEAAFERMREAAKGLEREAGHNQ